MREGERAGYPVQVLLIIHASRRQAMVQVQGQVKIGAVNPRDVGKNMHAILGTKAVSITKEQKRKTYHKWEVVKKRKVRAEEDSQAVP
jgi:alkyl hydroperoxide reductase subunit AhpC